MVTPVHLEEALQAVGDLLQAEGATAHLVLVSGAALNLLGLVPRTTSDVDIIARTEGDAEALEQRPLVPPEPLPEPVRRAIRTVARDFNLPLDWMNTEVSLQWRAGLPPRMADEIAWRTYGALYVGLVSRRSLIALKLFAAVDGGPRDVHFQDLQALQPNAEELEEAQQWVLTQDASGVFKQMVQEVVTRVLDAQR